jgi:hypothetical protein
MKGYPPSQKKGKGFCDLLLTNAINYYILCSSKSRPVLTYARQVGYECGLQRGAFVLYDLQAVTGIAESIKNIGG